MREGGKREKEQRKEGREWKRKQWRKKEERGEVGANMGEKREKWYFGSCACMIGTNINSLNIWAMVRNTFEQIEHLVLNNGSLKFLCLYYNFIMRYLMMALFAIILALLRYLYHFLLKNVWIIYWDYIFVLFMCFYFYFYL